MANNNISEMTYEGIKSRGIANDLWAPFERAEAYPMDITSVFGSYETAASYAKNGATSYAGQTIAVAGAGVESKIYKITSNGTLVELVDAIALNLKQDKIEDLDDIRSGAALGVSASQDVSELKYKVTTLVGEDSGKTVRTIANEELAAKLIPGDAQDSLDTLAEIAAWIQEHPEDAAAMNVRIGNLENGLTQTLKDAKAYADESVNTVSENLATHINANTNEFIAVRSEFASADTKTLEDAKAHAQGLVDAHAKAVNTKFDGLPLSSGDTKKSIILKDNGNTAVSEGAVSLGGSKKNVTVGHYALTGPINSDSGYSYSVNNSTFTDDIIAFFDAAISSNEQVYGNRNKFIGYDVENSTLTFEKPVEYSFDSQNYTAIYVENKHYPIGYVYETNESMGSESINEGSFATNRSVAGGLLSNSSNEARAYAPLSTAEGTGGYSSKIGRHFQGEQLVPGSDDENGYAGAYGVGSHVEGNLTVTTMAASYGHAEGHSTTTTAFAGHSEGRQTIAGNISAHAEGNSPMALGPASHAEGKGDNEYGSVYYKSIEKITDLVDVWFSGNTNGKYKKGFSAALSEASHTEGLNNISVGVASHVEGTLNATIGDFSHSEGRENISKGEASHTSGFKNTANGAYSVSMGRNNTTDGDASFTVGYKNNASGIYAFAGGKNSESRATNGFAWGDTAISNGRRAIAFGLNVTANNDNEFACGKNNISSANTLFSIGNGTTSAPSNALEVTLDGNVMVQGAVYEGNEKLSDKYALKSHTHEEFASLSGLSETIAELDSTVDNHKNRLDAIENDCLVLTESKSLKLLTNETFNLGAMSCYNNFTSPIYLAKKSDGTYLTPLDSASTIASTETYRYTFGSGMGAGMYCNGITVRPYEIKTVRLSGRIEAKYLMVKVENAFCTLPSNTNSNGVNKDFGILLSNIDVDGSSTAIRRYCYAIYPGETLAIPLSSANLIPDNFILNNNINDVWSSSTFSPSSIIYNPTKNGAQVTMTHVKDAPTIEYHQQIVGSMTLSDNISTTSVTTNTISIPRRYSRIVDKVNSSHYLKLPQNAKIGDKFEIVNNNYKKAMITSNSINIALDAENGLYIQTGALLGIITNVIFDGENWLIYKNL